MPQPKKKSKKPQIETKKLSCASCGELKDEQEYFVSYNPIHSTNRLPYCKICLKKMIVDINGEIDIEKLKNTLKLIDRPYIHSLWLTSVNDEKNSLGIYMKNLALNYKTDTWAKSKFSPEDRKSENIIDFSIDIFITKEMTQRWGTKHDKEDYYELENFYNDMEISNNIETAQDIAYLKKLALISLKMDRALQEGNFGEAKQLGDLFSKYMADSKFRAMDKTDADKTGGIRNFGMIYAEVEKDGFIPPWEHYRKIKGISQDIVDKTIMHIENFTLKLNRIEKMVHPPSDTPQLDLDEIDYENTIKINDIEVDINFDEIDGSDV